MWVLMMVVLIPTVLVIAAAEVVPPAPIARPPAQVEFINADDAAAQVSASQPTGEPPNAGQPLHLNLSNIVRTIYRRNPTIRAAREDMKASKHGLDEFRANLSRLEPFVEARSDLSDFPNRRGAFGNTVESVVGVKKETFEGAVLSTEVGASYSRFEFDPGLLAGSPVESGAGALVRTRLEVPFFGSRKRQDRIIAQAFQDSTARKAQLDYVTGYRSVAEGALSRFNYVVYYHLLSGAYDRWSVDLDSLLKDGRVRDRDRARVESVKANAVSYRSMYTAYEQEYLTVLRSFLAMAPSAPVRVEIPRYRLSPYAEQSRAAEGLNQLIQRARTNNPTFRVLNDAIRNSELRRDQAIKGRYDVTTFLEGTLFPIGSETFDNRFEGWTVGGGVNVRLNDRRVLRATRLKAEAQIRQFQAQIEAEEINIHRMIVTTTRAMWDNHQNRTQLIDVGRRKREELKTRIAEYANGNINIDQLLATRGEIASNESNLANNLFNSADREASLFLAIGQIYEIVGLKIGIEEEP